jgi:hypothetical protein
MYHKKLGACRSNPRFAEWKIETDTSLLVDISCDLTRGFLNIFCWETTRIECFRRYLLSHNDFGWNMIGFSLLFGFLPRNCAKLFLGRRSETSETDLSLRSISCRTLRHITITQGHFVQKSHWNRNPFISFPAPVCSAAHPPRTFVIVTFFGWANEWSWSSSHYWNDFYSRHGRPSRADRYFW